MTFSVQNTTTEQDERAALAQFCARLGRDPLLVQGAGGNASVKQGDALWVKASGFWLAEAAEKAIFLPVDLPKLQAALTAEDFSVTPQPLGESGLRPSIETLLHALMPQRYVLHLHAVDALAHLVRQDAQATLPHALGALAAQAAWVGYAQPGAPLAHAVSSALATHPGTSLLLLQNHGIVLGASTQTALEILLADVLAHLRLAPKSLPVTPAAPPPAGYVPIRDARLHALAQNVSLAARLTSDWALYPDHVVFLGAKPVVYANMAACRAALASADATSPDLCFVLGQGTYTRPEFSAAKLAQLQCYFEVLIRLADDARCAALNDSAVAALLNWDAEKYRQKIAKC